MRFHGHAFPMISMPSPSPSQDGMDPTRTGTPSPSHGTKTAAMFMCRDGCDRQSHTHPFMTTYLSQLYTRKTEPNVRPHNGDMCTWMGFGILVDPVATHGHMHLPSRHDAVPQVSFDARDLARGHTGGRGRRCKGVGDVRMRDVEGFGEGKQETLCVL